MTFKVSRRYRIDARKGTYVKNGGAKRHRFEVIQDLRQRGREPEGAFFVTSPVIGGLTWSDYFVLAERAALLPCKPRPLVLSDD